MQSEAIQQDTVDHVEAWQAVVMADSSLGEWVTKVEAALKALEGGAVPLGPEASRTTGIAANIPPTSKNMP